jgi:branched-subunit amino acid transport protein AzlD
VLAAALLTLSSAVIFFGLALPPGFLLVRLSGVEAAPLPRLALAAGAGIPILMTTVALELLMGGPWIALPIALVSIVVLRPGAAFVASLRVVAMDLAAGCVLAMIAFMANFGDVTMRDGELSVRPGFDVSDRAIYGTVAQELERAPLWALENPGFAPLPLQYSYLPSLAGVLLRRYAGADALTAFGLVLPSICMIFTAVAAAALAASVGATSAIARAISILLLTLGGDLSFLVPGINQTWLERARPFFVFFSFGSESLFYNPWMLGLPLSLVALLSILNLQRVPFSRSAVVIPALVVAALFQTKVFAFIAIWTALSICALAWRDVKLGLAAVASLLLASPGMLLVLGSGAARDGTSPLGFEPLAFVLDAIMLNPSLTAVAISLGVPVAAVIVILGGLGFRLLGVRPLLSAARDPSARGPRFLLVTALISMVGAFTTVGRPIRLDGIQFMTVAFAILSVYAAPPLAAAFRGSAPRRLVAVLVLIAATFAPVRYLLAKGAPETFTSPTARDRDRFTLPAPMVTAAEWLRRYSPRTVRLVMPLTPDALDRGGLRPTYVSVLSARRLVALPVALSVSAALAAERQSKVLRLYETQDPMEAETLLTDLGATWIWENADHPLRFSSTRVVPRAEFGTVRLWSFGATP